MPERILTVDQLRVNFKSYLGYAEVLDGVNLELNKGELFGLAGESGCGKSVTMHTIMRLLPRSATIESGQIMFGGRDLTKLSEKEMQKIRGKEISLVFQDPKSSLNPTMTIGKQVMETLLIHTNMSRSEAKDSSVEMLKKVQISNPEARMSQYPHQLSGGIKQRICFAMALMLNPKVLIADEFTTNLDVTIQAKMMDLVKDLKNTTHAAILFITHDLSLISQTCDRMAIMYAGQIVESGSVKKLFANPMHPYTVGLINSIPSVKNEDKYVQGIPGSVPSLINPPSGCRFYNRCPHAMRGKCDISFPAKHEVDSEHMVFCHKYVS